MRTFGILLCLVALALTGYSAVKYKAPAIQADIERRTITALSGVAGDEVEPRVDGRHVTLVGRTTEAGQADRLLQAAAGVTGVLGPIDRLERVPVASPYRFRAVKNEDGRVVVEGLAPSEQQRRLIEADVDAIFGSEASVDIEVAAGAPKGDWRTAIGAALDALATMRQGELSIDDADVVLEGEVVDKSNVAAIDLFAEALPEGFTWTHDVGVHRETVAPYTFAVVKDREGGINLTGYAPDEETRDALIEQAETIAGDRPVKADVLIAGGVPDGEWVTLVQAGISAMKDMEAGRFDVVDNDVSFASDPEVIAAEAPASAAADRPAGAAVEQPTARSTGNGVQTHEVETEPLDAASSSSEVAAAEVEAERPTPTLTIDKVEQGLWSVRGVLPGRQARDLLLATVERQAGVDAVETELELVDSAPDQDWLRFATDHVRTLNEVSAGRLSLDGYEAHLIGVVGTLEDIEPVENALAAIDPNMTVDLQPIDPRPAASLDLRLSPDDGLVLAGALPGGLTEGEALLALGIRRYDGQLAEDARGRAETWREELSGIGAVLPAFEALDLSLGGEQPRIEGRIHAHADADRIAREIARAFDDDRQPLLEIETTSAVYDDGARRTDPLTGEEQVHRRGYWLPVVDIAADMDTCQERSSALLANDKITFGRSEEDLDNRDQAILNELAGLAIACLDGTGLVLEIGGHTDSRGRARMNQELSQARADAVVAALALRGVDAGALVAVGHGDTQPVADNATDEGRAANRRITFEWKAAGDPNASGGEG